jgi:hypothetical protein
MSKKNNPPTGKVPSKATLTKHLRELSASLSERIADDGHALTKAEALAAVIWERAIGWTEIAEGGTEVPHKPEPWAVALIYERLEGRCPTAMDVGSTKGTVADRVSDLGRTKINNLTIASDDLTKSDDGAE